MLSAEIISALIKLSQWIKSCLNRLFYFILFYCGSVRRQGNQPHKQFYMIHISYFTVYQITKQLTGRWREKKLNISIEREKNILFYILEYLPSVYVKWADQLKRLPGDQWSTSAKDRVLWKELEKNFNSIGLVHLQSTHELCPALNAGGLALSGMFG